MALRDHSIEERGGDEVGSPTKLDPEKGPAEYLEQTSEVLDFGGDATLPSPPTLTEEEEEALYRKIDLRLMPILSVMYLCSFLDRGESTVYPLC